MSVENQLFVLGAKDPEMDRIEEIVAHNGFDAIHAAHDGERVGPGTAYTANNEIDPSRQAVFIETAVHGVDPIFVIDHHREGDPGYALSPRQYWAAASIGQLSTYLGVTETQHDRVLAAMDHCFSAAVRGECPGVEPGEVLDLKVRHIAASHNVDEGDVLELVDLYVGEMDVATSVSIGGEDALDLRHIDTGEGYSLSCLSLHLASAIKQEPVLIGQTDAGGRRKVVLDSASAEQVAAFTRQWSQDQDLVDVYGVPTRGYAGAYYKGDASL